MGYGGYGAVGWVYVGDGYKGDSCLLIWGMVGVVVLYGCMVVGGCRW